MSSMTEVFKDTFAFLEHNVDQSFYCEDFGKAETKALYDTLLKKHSKKDIKENRAEIRRAFKSYFQLFNQKISIFFQGFHTIIIKDLKKQVFGEFSKQYHQMAQELESLSDELENFKKNEGVYIIDKDALNGMGCSFENIEDRALKRELYKQAVREALGLSSRDLIFCMNERLTIKKFIEIGESVSAMERRAGGLPPDELEKIKNIVFEKNIYDEIEKAMNYLMETKLNFTVINNDYFRKNVIPLVQDELYKVISIYMDEDSDVALKRAFVNYIFREHFTNIHKMFARNLLDLHSRRDKNVESFIRYFDGNIELVEGQQIQKPDITDANGQRWNAVSILPIIIQKQKNDKEIETIEENNEKANRKIYDLEHRIETIENEIKGLEQNKESIHEQVKAVMTQSKELQDEITSLKDKMRRVSKEEREDLQQQVTKNSIEIKKLGREEDILRVKIRDLTNFVDVNKTKITNINVDIHAQEKLINDNKLKKENLLRLHQPIQEKYDLIVDALAKTLMHKY
jgi:hypothetical protein